MPDKKRNTNAWINPIGGIGDTLMLSGVLKMSIDRFPEKKYNLVRRTEYTGVLKGHPAIELIGHPLEKDEIITTDYWNKEKIGPDSQRAFQILARMFGLETPVEETLYLHNINNDVSLLEEQIPWKRHNIIFAPFSIAPRKTMHPIHWHQLVEKLVAHDDILPIQVGKQQQTHIKNTFSLLGATTLEDTIPLLKKCDLVVGCDSLFMHLAHLAGIPAVIIWGPTSPGIYGYESHYHFVAPMDHCPEKDRCLGSGLGGNYAKPCPLNDTGHCMNRIDINQMYQTIIKIINQPLNNKSWNQKTLQEN